MRDKEEKKVIFPKRMASKVLFSINSVVFQLLPALFKSAQQFSQHFSAFFGHCRQFESFSVVKMAFEHNEYN